jgi:cytidine deaminase
MNEGLRGDLVAIAVTGGIEGVLADPVAPCGRCRQVLSELAQLGGTDPLVWCAGASEVREYRLSDLLPNAFGPASLR